MTKDSHMVNGVARAICKANFLSDGYSEDTANRAVEDGVWRNFMPEARAAIEASGITALREALTKANRAFEREKASAKRLEAQDGDNPYREGYGDALAEIENDVISVIRAALTTDERGGGIMAEAEELDPCPYSAALESEAFCAWHEGYRAGMERANAVWNAAFDKAEPKEVGHDLD